MAPKAIDYSNTIIYKLEHEDDKTLFYVGSTTDFIRRKASHKSQCNNLNSKAYNCKVYQMIRDNGGWPAFKMVELKKFPCNDANEAFAEEENFRKALKPIMNSIKAYTGLTQQEQNKQWRDDNPDYNKQYDIDNPEQKKIRQRKWRANNPDYDKNYRINNLDKIRERKKIKMTCDCGAVICKEGLSKHLDTGKHFRWKQNNNIQ